MLLIFNLLTRQPEQFTNLVAVEFWLGTLCFAQFILIMVHVRWGQVFILDALSRYKAPDAREAENIVERVTRRLQHANFAVVLSAVKVTFVSHSLICLNISMVFYQSTYERIIIFCLLLFLIAFQMILQQMELITSTDVVRNLCKKMAPPLVTLLSAEPEIQYVALRNINLIVQRRPTILAHEIKVD